MGAASSERGCPEMIVKRSSESSCQRPEKTHTLSAVIRGHVFSDRGAAKAGSVEGENAWKGKYSMD